MKFDDDFDFEKANNQFEELINVFSKTKVSDDPKTDVQVFFVLFCFWLNFSYDKPPFRISRKTVYLKLFHPNR